MLEIKHLRLIQTLSETGTLSAAAKRLFLTQSALSHQILALEEYYGLRLFERKSQPLKLTVAGKRLLQLANVLLSETAIAERDLARLKSGNAGDLRIAVECHTCFDWLMPAMDKLRDHWPEVELDILSGFHTDPVNLLSDEKADVAIVTETPAKTGIVYYPLFSFEIVGLVGRRHALAGTTQLNADDFANDTLITYAVPEALIDLIQQVLKPAGLSANRRTTESTVAILQLVASRRGLAALPNWSVQPYVDRGYVLAKRIGEQGLWRNLYAATWQSFGEQAYVQDFMNIIREVGFQSLKGIRAIEST
ncbi:LysR family transcriptional regulator [Leeia sp. TBRC 13508]|uniref:HTH-type transcriptional regulator MetR n=1 Tax=Leeia speluncae TaxID=2884804 RepID=A0ABS8D166_9NEIS|nr:LysR family transcriptional regulator [Leeia speluncae]MCB6181951.1 LysR family transcriptional regulator [Leeia speluncae]